MLCVVFEGAGAGGVTTAAASETSIALNRSVLFSYFGSSRMQVPSAMFGKLVKGGFILVLTVPGRLRRGGLPPALAPRMPVISTMLDMYYEY